MANPSVTVNQNYNNNNSNSSSGGKSYGSYGSSGSKSSGGKSNSNNTAIKNLGSIANYNANTLTKGYKMQNKAYDISDKQNARQRDTDILNAKRESTDDFQARQSQLQSSTAAILDRAGNAVNGSGIYDIWDNLNKVDDAGSVENLNTLRGNMNTAYGNYYEALSTTNNARNNSRLETYKALRALESDTAAQINNIDPDQFVAPGTAKGSKVKDSSSKKSDKDKKGKTKKSKYSTYFGSADFLKNNKLNKAAKIQNQGFFRADGAGRAGATSRDSGSMDIGYLKEIGAGYDRSR